MEETKILLSEDELSLVQDTLWLLTKNRIIAKAKDMFGALAHRLRKQVEAPDKLPELVYLFSAKVYKGEYYQGLPYVMLDYPRVFGKEDVFALRTMFWWGNFFSVTLHLKGSYATMFGDALIKSKTLLVENGFSISRGDDEWRHDLSDHVPIDDTFEQMVRDHSFVKIAAKISLSRWNDAMELMGSKQDVLLRCLV